MANFTGLAAGRDAVLRRAGWDVAEQGLHGGPRVRVLVGAERHDTVDLVPALPRARGARAGRGRRPGPAARRRPGGGARTADGAPTIVVLQAGNVHSGAFDPFPEAIAAAHAHGAWVHVDGAFGLWAAASPSYRHLIAGHDAGRLLGHGRAQDAQRALRQRPGDRARRRGAARGDGHARRLPDPRRAGEPFDKVPEISRRGRAFTVWAVLRSLGRTGVAELVDRLCRHAATFAAGLADIPGATVLNEVEFTQVCASFGQTTSDDPGGRTAAARRRHRLDERLDLARPQRAADLGEQLVDHRRRRGAQPGRRTQGRQRGLADPPASGDHAQGAGR